MSARLPFRRDAARATILQALAKVGREHSDATVLFHSTIAGLLGLHPTDYKALGILERTGPMSAGEIARSCGLATASVTDLIDRLERKGFVRRTRDAHDRRRVLVEPAGDRVEAARPALCFDALITGAPVRAVLGSRADPDRGLSLPKCRAPTHRDKEGLGQSCRGGGNSIRTHVRWREAA